MNRRGVGDRDDIVANRNRYCPQMGSIGLAAAFPAALCNSAAWRPMPDRKINLNQRLTATSELNDLDD
jgi:hypothetical protein